MQAKVQKWTSTTLPRRSCKVSGAALIQSVMPVSSGAEPRFSSFTVPGSWSATGGGSAASARDGVAVAGGGAAVAGDAGGSVVAVDAGGATAAVGASGMAAITAG